MVTVVTAVMYLIIAINTVLGRQIERVFKWRIKIIKLYKVSVELFFIQLCSRCNKHNIIGLSEMITNSLNLKS